MKNIYTLLFTFLITSLSFGQIVINEVDADTPGSDTAEFVELKASPNMSLNGYIVVFFNGSNDQSYGTWDLTGFTADANGFFILGNDASTADIELPAGGSGYVQNGADAIAIYQDSAANFPDGSSPTTANLIDAIVYGTNDSDDTDLLTALGETTQYNESANGASANESLQLNTAGDAYETKAPTYRAENDAAVCELSLNATSAQCDTFTAGSDTYTATVEFSGGGTSTYSVMASSGTVDLSSGNPSSDATGTITITGITEGTDVTLTVQDGGLCNLTSNITSPSCEPTSGLPIYEGFDYTVGEELNNQTNWVGFNGGASITIGGPGGLTYPGLASSSQTGNHVAFQGSGQESGLEFTPVTSGPVYTSFIINLNDISAITDLTDGGYFAALANSNSSYDLRAWVKPNTDPVATTYEVAIGVATSSPTFTGSYIVGDPVLIVMSYEPGTGVVKGWVNPTSFGGAEPTPDFSETDPDIENTIDRFIIRQDSNGETPGILFDELRIGTTYAEVTPQTLSTSEFNTTQFSLYPNPTNTGVVTIRSSRAETIVVSLYDVLGKNVMQRTLSSDNTLNVSNLKAGVYFARITQNDATVTKKLVIK